MCLDLGFERVVVRRVVEDGGESDGVGRIVAVKERESRSDWNRKVSQVKTAIKGFLKEEMKWDMPDEKALKGKESVPAKPGN